MSLVTMILILGLAIVGAVSLGGILNKYYGVFGIGKAYLVCIPFCLVFVGLGDLGSNTLMGVLKIVGGILVSYLLALLLTRKPSPLVWICMILAGFGWIIRLIMSFIGFAMPIAQARAEENFRLQQEEEARRRMEEERIDQIKGEAYRKYGERGQVNSDGTYWRADSSSEWRRVDPRTGRPM